MTALTRRWAGDKVLSPTKGRDAPESEPPDMGKKKEAPAEEPEVEETTDEEVELDEATEADEADEAPKKAKGGQPEVTFGVSDLAKHLTKVTKRQVTPRELRTQIRKMAREDKPRVEREITAGNRSRYDWPKGLEDPEVKRIIKAVTGGELEENKKAALEKLKSDKAAKKGKDEGKGGKKGKGKKAAAASDDDAVDEIDESELEDTE